MKIELLNKLDNKKLEQELNKFITDNNQIKETIDYINNLEIEKKAAVIASAGKLSRYNGNVNEVFDKTKDLPIEKNNLFIKRVINMGHTSILEHDYHIFTIQDVSPIIEQTIIEERFSSFTIKSRREVDFSQVGFYTPDFHDQNGNILKNNDIIKQEYNKYMKSLFNSYNILVNEGINKEDARFVLPYCYHSNIFMTINSHTLIDMIVKFTKTKYANIQELNEFGNKLYDIAKENIPYIIDIIDTTNEKKVDSVDLLLKEKINDKNYKILDKPQLLNYTKNIDDTIIIAAIMRRYQFDINKATKIYEKLCLEDSNFKENIMKKIAFESDGLELTQVNFEFQIPLSFAVLTHLTRHRTHNILIPDFAPVVDLTQYKIPPKIQKEHNQLFKDIFEKNNEMFNHFKNDYGIREEDLIYFTLSGNLVNIVTNMDGKTLKHILNLRECSKTQWETRIMAHEMHKQISKIEGAENFTKLLGPTCITQGFCKEGKESCGKILTLKHKTTEN